MKATTKAFLCGLLTGIIFVIVSYGMYTFVSHFSLFPDPVIASDEAALPHIRNEGFALTSGTTYGYYFDTGFNEHVTLAAFSAPQAELDRIVEAKTGKRINQLTPWHGQFNQLEWYDPEFLQGKYRTYYYDVEHAKTGWYFNEARKDIRDSWYLIYDREHERVYYRRDT